MLEAAADDGLRLRKILCPRVFRPIVVDHRPEAYRPQQRHKAPRDMARAEDHRPLSDWQRQIKILAEHRAPGRKRRFLHRAQKHLPRLVDKLHQLIAGGMNVVLSDIPGCGIGALDHVYLQLLEKEPEEFELMPFTCIVDPERLKMLMPDKNSPQLPAQMAFLLDAQMKEADLIVLNKIDLLSSPELHLRMRFLHKRYPDTPVMAMSALSGAEVRFSLKKPHLFCRKLRHDGRGQGKWRHSEAGLILSPLSPRPRRRNRR